MVNNFSDTAARIWGVAGLLRGNFKQSQYGRVGIVGYEIPVGRHFCEYIPPRPLEEPDADLDRVSREILQLLQEVRS